MSALGAKADIAQNPELWHYLSMFIAHRILFLTLISIAVLGSCTNEGSHNHEIESKIERQVLLAHPDIELDRYARYYVYSKNGKRVFGQFVFVVEGYEHFYGSPGISVWGEEEDWPIIMDGGCTVIYIEHYTASNGITNVSCNGNA